MFSKYFGKYSKMDRLNFGYHNKAETLKKMTLNSPDARALPKVECL